MISWSLLLNNPVARLIGKIALGILFLLTFGKVNQWRGAQGAKAKSDAAALKKTVKGAEDARKGRAEAIEKLRQGQTPEEIVRGNDAKW